MKKKIKTQQIASKGKLHFKKTECILEHMNIIFLKARNHENKKFLIFYSTTKHERKNI